jgi:hypothetical protein
MKYPIVGLLLVFAAQSGAQGISAEGTAQEGVTAEDETYNGTGTVQDSHADGDIKLIDLLDGEADGPVQDSAADGDVKVIDFLKSDAKGKEKPERGSKKDK